ncbi:MAG TPA: hypothetical protein VGJ52_04635 [Vicinamibacterales bacterium]
MTRPLDSARGRPDIVLLGPEWPERALLRAQLLEDGYDVVATDAWPIPRQFLRPGMKPRVLIIDLRGLPAPHEALDEVRGVMPPERVVVVTAMGTMSADEIRRLGFHVVTRPATMRDVVAAAASLLSLSSTSSC